MTGLERAIAFATEAHAGQLDKQGEPYIEHCKRVMDALAWSLLTRNYGQRRTYWEYIDRIANPPDGGFIEAAPLAREVKVADLRDNLGRWVPELGDDLRKRYERALARLTEGDSGGE
jgi:hypothetical protein